ncbi:MAG: VOC family protein [Actinomycetota bacterium]|nr:VOC family protein [Actinomycetota bacterium]
MDKVSHFEIPVDDLARAMDFYSSTFGWKLEEMEGMDYTSVVTTSVDPETQMPTEPGAINGGMMLRTEETPVPVITMEVDSVDDSLSRTEAAGGSVVKPKTSIPGMGSYAYFKDTEGNILGLWENE